MKMIIEIQDNDCLHQVVEELRKEYPVPDQWLLHLALVSLHNLRFPERYSELEGFSKD